MAETRRGGVDRWSEHVDQLCDDGETVERRLDLEDSTVVVTNRRVMAFASGSDGPDFRHVDRPNVGTVTVDADERLDLLCWGIVAAMIGIGLVETARAVGFTEYVPTFDLRESDSIPGASAVERVVDAGLSAIETALLVLDWAVLLSGGVAIVVAAAFVARYVRSRSHRLVLRVRGDDDVEVPVGSADLEADVAAELEAAIRPGSSDRNCSPEEGRSTGDGSTDVDEGDARRGGGRSDDGTDRTDRRRAEWLGDEESG